MVHYQRPGSVVHYYQQVGRAGRAVPEAFGILLAGEEDQEISDYFIRTAFPSLEQVNAILAALRASDGMTTYELQREVNLSWGAIEKALRLLSVETPSPVTRVGGRWSATPVAYAFDEERVVRLTELRQAEQEDVLPCFLSPWPSTLCPQANELVFPMDLSNDAKTALLLCGIFPDREEARPLSPGEFSKLLTWLGANGLRPGELVQPGGDDLARSISITGLENKRLADLLKRGAAMAFAVEKWLAGGLWIVTRTDPYYPRRLADRLGHQAPPLLYGAGPCDLLDHGGLAVVGSRNVDSQGFDYAREAGGHCARSGIAVISGGARGVDQSAMAGALEENGNAIGVLSDGLLRASVSRFFREALSDQRLTLLSPYHPEAGFNVGNAMNRNKYIYALSDHALVVSADKGKGGTWSGAVEELNRSKGVSVCVRTEGTPPEGNLALLRLGARPFPPRPWNASFDELLKPSVIPSPRSENIQMSLFDDKPDWAKQETDFVFEPAAPPYGVTTPEASGRKAPKGKSRGKKPASKTPGKHTKGAKQV